MQIVNFTISKGYMHPIFIALFTIAKLWKQPMSINRWMDKEDMKYTHTHTLEYYSDIKKNDILLFTTAWIELENIMLSQISQRKTNTIWSYLYVKSKKQNKWAKEKKGDRDKTRNRLLTIENKLMVIRGDVGWRIGIR